MQVVHASTLKKMTAAKTEEWGKKLSAVKKAKIRVFWSHEETAIKLKQSMLCTSILSKITAYKLMNDA